MDITNSHNEEQKTHYIVRITDVASETLALVTSLAGYDDVTFVSLETAVEPLISLLPDIERNATVAKERCSKAPVDRLSNDESASIMLYTMGWQPLDQCLYVALNQMLRSKERDQLPLWILYLKLFVTALSRLPSINQTVYCEAPLDLTFIAQGDQQIYVGDYNFTGLSIYNELTFRKGDKLEILERYRHNDWWKAKNCRTKLTGYVPTDHILAVIDLTTCDWYFIDTSRHDAERFLEQVHNGQGAFLIRPSKTHQDEESLSILHFDSDEHFQARHYRIRRTDQGLYYIARARTFSSEQTLVNHYQTANDGLCCLLTHPCRKIEATIQDDLPELDRSQLVSLELLSRRKSDEIHKGKYGYRDVTVRCMPIDNQDHSHHADRCLREAKIVKEFRHANILRFYGVCTQENPMLMVTEMVTHGCLLDYLHDKGRKHVTLLILLGFATQILKGLRFLEGKRYVHCDLGARNIFLAEDNIVKIGGFNLARMLHDDRAIVDETSEFLIKWTAPEVITNRAYTIKADVWSFGILLYELITYGSCPYPDLSDDEACQLVLDGYRMLKPHDCHEQYYQIMSSCWKANPDHRPTYEILSTRFNEFTIDTESIIY